MCSPKQDEPENLSRTKQRGPCGLLWCLEGRAGFSCPPQGFWVPRPSGNSVSSNFGHSSSRLHKSVMETTQEGLGLEGTSQALNPKALGPASVCCRKPVSVAPQRHSRLAWIPKALMPLAGKPYSQGFGLRGVGVFLVTMPKRKKSVTAHMIVRQAESSILSGLDPCGHGAHGSKMLSRKEQAMNP